MSNTGSLTVDINTDNGNYCITGSDLSLAYSQCETRKSLTGFRELDDSTLGGSTDRWIEFV